MEASLLTPSASKSTDQSKPPALPTFMDHIHELRGRLFWIAVIFIVSSAAAYPFRDVIISFLVAPLKGQELYYLTPVGGFSFIVRIITYAGIVMTLPAIIFHLYRYLQPAIGHIKKRLVISYVLFSTFLAFSGLCFAYYISLPAALRFLTGLDLSSVTAMLTVDAYYSFVTTYLIGAALLFQLPLILLIINSVKPLKPSKLMGYQRHVLLGSFVVAAIISPTPDMTNQALLAAPIIVMYQIGIIMIWVRNLARRKPTVTERPLLKETVSKPAINITDNTNYDWIDQLVLQDSIRRKPAIKKPYKPVGQPESVAAAVVNAPPVSGYRRKIVTTAQLARPTRQLPRPIPLATRSQAVVRDSLLASSIKKVATANVPARRPVIDGISVPVRLG